VPPPVLLGGFSGSTTVRICHQSDLSDIATCRGRNGARFVLVHIGNSSSNRAATLESQVIRMIQELFGQTLKDG
jgi:hypothetical protein